MQTIIQSSSLSLKDDQYAAWLMLARDTRFSILQKHDLLEKVGSPVEIYQTGYRDLCHTLGVRPSQSKNNKFQTLSDVSLEADLAWLAQMDNHLICLHDNHYPALLREISDPPICLFARGSLSLLNEPKISVVGSRRPTPAGIKQTQVIAGDLAKLGIAITSGMALGIDGVAHRAALDLNEPTIAVMGCGLDIVSPAQHRALFEQIADEGLLLSEYPLAYPASRYTFPQRNRIVSGLAYGVVIVEAADKSGTLITARLAMEQNREVFVVPGSPINPQYIGSHRLIKQGASLVTKADDIISELSGCLREMLGKMQSYNAVPEIDSLGEEAKYPFLKHIDFEPTRVDQIILSSGLTASEVSSMLLILEVEGLVLATYDGCYSRLS